MKTLLVVACLAAAGAMLAGAEEKLALDFYQTDVAELLALYEKLTGLHVVKSVTLIGTASAKSNGPVSKEKAIQLIEAGLFATGFPIVQTAPDKVEVLGIGDSVTSRPLPTLTRADDLPKNERVVRLIYKLKARDPKDLLPTLEQSLLPTHMMIPSVTIDETSRALIIVDRSSALRGIVKLIAELDQPAPK
jgi:type II secretory pathway component GspD/PulD (secretin)